VNKIVLTVLNIATFLSVFVSVPRWTQVLATIDSRTAAIAEGIFLEGATFALSLAFNLTAKAAEIYAAKVKRNEELQADQGKQSRMPNEAPELRGSGSTVALFLVLLALEVVIQAPYYYSKVAGLELKVVLTGLWLWMWAGLLVGVNAVVTLGYTTSIRYIQAALPLLGEAIEPVTWLEEAVKVRVMYWLSGTVPEQTAPAPEPVEPGPELLDYEGLLEAARTGTINLDDHTGDSIAELTTVGPRQARKWRDRAKEALKGNGAHSG